MDNITFIRCSGDNDDFIELLHQKDRKSSGKIISGDDKTTLLLTANDK